MSPPNLWGPETFLNLSRAQKEVNGAPQNDIPKRPGPAAPAGTTARGQLQAGGRSSSEGQSDQEAIAPLRAGCLLNTPLSPELDRPHGHPDAGQRSRR